MRGTGDRGLWSSCGGRPGGRRLVALLGTALVLAAAWLLSCASLPASDAGQHGGAHAITRANAFLYGASRPGSDAIALYLLGSVHLMDAPVSLGPQVAADFARAGALVLELDPRSLGPETAGALMVRYGLLAPGESLDALLAPETMDMLLARLEQPDFTPQERMAALRLRPWAIATLLLFEKQAAAAGARADLGVDLVLAERADLAGLPILELETADEQMMALASLSPGQADALLRQTLEVSAEVAAGGPDEIATLLAAWKSGDEDRLAEVLFADAGENAELYASLFVARNEVMSLGLQELLADDPDRVLFAVLGAGHLIGEDSVTEMLRAEGFTVERLR